MTGGHREGIRRGLAWSVAVGVVALGIWWFNPDRKATGPRPGATLVWARGADTARLDPADVDDGESAKVLSCIYEGLTQFASGTTRVEPCLAESWEISQDGRIYRFRLREGVLFHDGSLLTAAVAAESFRRQMDTAHRFHFPDARFPYWEAMFKDIEEIEADGARDLVIRLAGPHAPFLANLATFPAYIISVDAMERLGPALARNPVGTGPFRFEQWLPNDRITLRRWDRYWGEPAELEQVVFRVVPSPDTRLLQVQTGSATAMDGLDTVQIPLVEGDAELVLHRAPGMNVGYLAMNTEQSPMSDVRFRRAVAMALDKRALVQAAYQGAAVAAVNSVPPSFLGYHAALPDLPHDPEAARALLADVPGHDRELSLYVMSNPRPYMPNPPRVAELVKEDLQRAGLRVRIVVNEWGSHRTALMNGSHDLGLLGWIGDNGDPDNFLWVLFGPDSAKKGSALNVSFFISDELNAILAEARRVLDAERRSALYRQAQELLQREMPVVPLVHAMDMAVTRRDVAGFVLQPTGDLVLETVRIGGVAGDQAGSAGR